MSSFFPPFPAFCFSAQQNPTIISRKCSVSESVDFLLLTLGRELFFFNTQVHNALVQEKGLFFLPETCISYLVTSDCLVDFSLSFVELPKKFVCFGIPLLHF